MHSRFAIAVLGAALLFAAARPAGAQVPAAPEPTPAQMPPIPTPATVGQTVGFDEAVRIATEKSPDAARAAQAILRAEAVLQGARGVFLPTVNGTVTTTILNDERGFQGQVTQPQSQAAFGVSAAFPVLAASRWAQATQAADQVAISRIGRDETRRQIALAVSEAYLAVINQHRQVAVNTRAIRSSARIWRSRSVRSIRVSSSATSRWRATERRWPASKIGTANCTTAAHAPDGWPMPVGARYCGEKLAIPTGTQSFQLSRRTRSAAATCASDSRMSTRPDSHVGGSSPGTSKMGSPAVSTGPSATSRTPSASCARRRSSSVASSSTSSLDASCAARTSFRRLPAPACSRADA